VKIFLIIIFIFGYVTRASAIEDLKSQIHLIPEQKEYHEGDIVELDLKIWPIESADLDEFKKIEGTALYGALNIEQVTSVLNSENNADVVEIKATAVVVGAPDNNQAYVAYKNDKIKLISPVYRFLSIKSKNEDYYIINQASVSSKKYLLIIISIVILLIGIVLVIKKLLKPKEPKNDVKKSFLVIFTNANQREDFEMIYAKKSEWIRFVLIDSMIQKNFFDIMEIHQYKKDWTSEELAEVINSFEPIRRSLL
jgi:hypothetical protein